MSKNFVVISGQQVEVKTRTEYLVDNMLFYSIEDVEHHLKWTQGLALLSKALAYTLDFGEDELDVAENVTTFLVNLGLLDMSDVIVKLKPLYTNKENNET